MPGVLECQMVEREHAKAFASASPEVREEARRYADFVLMERGWLCADSPITRITEQELERFHIMIHGSTDYTEELVESARVTEPDELTDTDVLGLNFDQNASLMEDYLTQLNCELNESLADYWLKSPARIPDWIVPITSSNHADCPVDESDDHPAPAINKGKQAVACNATTSNEDRVSVRDSTSALSLGASPLPSTSGRALKSSRQANREAGPSSLVPSTRSHCPEAIEEGENIPPITSSSAVPVAHQSTEAEDTEGNGYPCPWKRYFRGSCSFVAVDHQRHDRHLVTHVPDAEGYQITLYKCRWSQCDREFSRRSSFRRHLATVHKCDEPNAYLEVPSQPWWYPKDLFLSNEYRMLPCQPQPPGNKLAWHEKVRDILDKKEVNTAKKHAAEGGTVNPSTSRDNVGSAEPHANSGTTDGVVGRPPAKRRKVG